MIVFRLRTVLKLIIACIEASFGSIIVAGSQSDLVNYIPCIVHGQLIFRVYELLAIPVPNMQQYYQFLNIFSITSMVLFVQFWHNAITPLTNNTERLEYVRLYEGHGELCNIRIYWSEQRIKLIIAYTFAVTLKLYNSYKFT